MKKYKYVNNKKKQASKSLIINKFFKCPEIAGNCYKKKSFSKVQIARKFKYYWVELVKKNISEIENFPENIQFVYMCKKSVQV